MLWEPPLLAPLTNVGNTAVLSWGVPNAYFAQNVPLVEVLSCASMAADANGGVTAQTASGEPMISHAYMRSGMCVDCLWCDVGYSPGVGRG